MFDVRHMPQWFHLAFAWFMAKFGTAAIKKRWYQYTLPHSICACQKLTPAKTEKKITCVNEGSRSIKIHQVVAILTLCLLNI